MGWCWSGPKAMKRIFAFLRRAYLLRQTRCVLYAMDDRMLRDIGLRREQISSTRFL